MASRGYVAMVEADGVGFAVRFPDLPECRTAAGSLLEAALQAQAVLAAYAADAARRGLTLPPPATKPWRGAGSGHEVARLVLRVEAR